MIRNNVFELIGNTPLVKLNKIIEKYDLSFNLYAKLERNNPSGSVKDRAAYYIIKDAFEKRLINKDSTIIEASSGNMGISLALISSYYNLKCIITMPSNASKERIKMMEAYGAKVILTKKEEGMKGSINEANRLAKEIPSSFLTKQFENEANIKAHYETTSKEILSDLDNKLDVFIAGIGTSGTLIGNAKRFKEELKSVEIIGVEPLSSPLINKNIAGSHLIQGIGANFIPSLYNKNYVDRVLDISNENAYRGVKLLSSLEGLFVGISSGASLMAALTLNKEIYKNKNVVIILPDNGERYLSVEGLYE